MTYPISEIDGLPSFAASKLKSLGIRTTDKLLEAARTVKGRKALAAKTGITEQQLDEKRSGYTQAQAALEASHATVKAADAAVQRLVALQAFSKINAPFAGRHVLATCRDRE